MKNTEINNHFGDIDLFLMDAILKGQIPENGSVLDVGCGEGRNGIYFMRNGYEYLGVDTDDSKLKLLEYLASSLSNVHAKFRESSIQNFTIESQFDIALCLRVFHFARDEKDFIDMWRSTVDKLKSGGIIFVSMDSAIENTLAKSLPDGLHEFPDGKVRFCLREDLYAQIRKGFEEIEPLRTVVHHEKRAQSFFLLRKS